MKQTAVEWLEQKAKEFAIDLNLLHYFEQAKEMEKQQIIDAYREAITNGFYDEDAEEYYNETFKNG
jgi:hypothetical protein